MSHSKSAGADRSFLRMPAQALRTNWLVALLLIVLPTAAYGQTTLNPPGPRYQIIEIPLRPLSIGNSGWVAGTTLDQHAATWSAKSGLHRIPLPSEFSYSECASINSRGEAVGTAATADSSRRVAFALRQNEVVLLPGEQSRGNAINEDGEIVGQTILPGSRIAGPVLWKNGSLIDLNICCAGSARNINGQHTIVGDTYDREGRYHAFVWDAVNGAHLVAVPGAEYSSTLGLDSRGGILVKAVPGGVFLYSGGKFRSVDIPKGTARALNNDGIVVGSFGKNPDAQHAFVWDKAHGMQDLNSLIAPKSDWTVEVASGINDHGEIVGWGDHGGVENAGFLLRPLRNQKPSGKDAARTRSVN